MHAVVIFVNIGTYHRARLRAAAEAIAAMSGRLTAVQVTSAELDHPWGSPGGSEKFPIRTLVEGEAARKLGRRAPFSRQAFDGMNELLEREKPDVVLLPGWQLPIARAALGWCLRAGAIPIVMSESNKDDHVRQLWRETYKRGFLRSCSAAIVGGRRHSEYLVELGMPAEAVFLGYDVVDNAYFAAGAAEARGDKNLRRQRGLPSCFFLASARFVEQKNLKGLLTAFALYRRRAGEAAWSLVLLGDGPQRSELEGMRDALGLKDSVKMPGFAPYELLPSYYGLAEAFVHASTMEPWGLVVNEATASGLPAIVSEACGCACELVVHEQNGFLFDPWNSEELCARMLELTRLGVEQKRAFGEASRHIISRWSPQRFGNAVRDAINFSASNQRGRFEQLLGRMLTSVGPRL
jgi:glycosyltransferase involved in cell wall biosynthesis